MIDDEWPARSAIRWTLRAFLGCIFVGVCLICSEHWRQINNCSDMQLNQYGPYVAKIQLRIKHNWHPPKLHESDCTNVTFKIQRNGSVTDLRLERPSGNIEADQAALRAIQSAAPFDPLPLRSDRLEMQFTFDYNLLNHGIQKKPL